MKTWREGRREEEEGNKWREGGRGGDQVEGGREEGREEEEGKKWREAGAGGVGEGVREEGNKWRESGVGMKVGVVEGVREEKTKRSERRQRGGYRIDSMETWKVFEEIWGKKKFGEEEEERKEGKEDNEKDGRI
ncbi:hypothetical protein Pmani_018213 [Petrolisthes manimaculis]|uniref:Uncharacterized protein n=1 Tax=Petrolisthes manimaculis TaxID=1843537 RepID=A0AAE1U6W7_9EUCA|nr:hypothetical protein Pmani_018213 [Petrolisthes manimaculis]